MRTGPFRPLHKEQPSAFLETGKIEVQRLGRVTESVTIGVNDQTAGYRILMHQRKGGARDETSTCSAHHSLHERRLPSADLTRQPHDRSGRGFSPELLRGSYELWQTDHPWRADNHPKHAGFGLAGGRCSRHPGATLRMACGEPDRPMP